MFWSRFYSILEPRNEDLVVEECVCSNSFKKEMLMDKETSSFKLKALGTLKTSLIFIALAVSIFHFEISYKYTQDSSRADSAFPIRFSFPKYFNAIYSTSLLNPHQFLADVVDNGADIFRGQVIFPRHHGGSGASVGGGLDHPFQGEFFFRLRRGEIFWWRVQCVGGEAFPIPLYSVANLAPFQINFFSQFQIGKRN